MRSIIKDRSPRDTLYIQCLFISILKNYLKMTMYFSKI